MNKQINRLVAWSQFATWPFSWLLFHALFVLDIRGRTAFAEVRDPFIIAANHVSFYDSFLFRLALGFRTGHLPLRFMAVTSFQWPFLNFLSAIGVIDFVYGLFGVFTVVPGRGLEKNLAEAGLIIAAGGNVVVYPEGQIFRGAGVGPFKRGAAVLAAETGAPVLPVAFRLGRRRFLRRELAVRIGEPIRIPPAAEPLAATGRLRQAVEGLYGR